jgi:hypothetical protein
MDGGGELSHCCADRRAAFCADRYRREGSAARDSRRRYDHATGNTVIDALHWTASRWLRRSQPDSTRSPRALPATGSSSSRRISARISVTMAAIGRIAERDDVAVLFPVHPNPNAVSVMDSVLGDCAEPVRIALMAFTTPTCAGSSIPSEIPTSQSRCLTSPQRAVFTNGMRVPITPLPGVFLSRSAQRTDQPG